MSDYDRIVRERQKLVRREMDRRGISIKAVQLDGDWSTPSTVLSYFPADRDAQPATMSVASLYRLLDTGALPAELLSLILPPTYALIRVPEGIDHDQMAEAMQDWLAAKHAAHHPASEAGREIGPGESDTLNRKLTVVRAA